MGAGHSSIHPSIYTFIDQSFPLSLFPPSFSPSFVPSLRLFLFLLRHSSQHATWKHAFTPAFPRRSFPGRHSQVLSSAKFCLLRKGGERERRDVTGLVRLQVEANLRSRCNEAEAEARGAAERERMAQERMKQHADGTDALQVMLDFNQEITLPPSSSPFLSILPLSASLSASLSLPLTQSLFLSLSPSLSPSILPPLLRPLLSLSPSPTHPLPPPSLSHPPTHPSSLPPSLECFRRSAGSRLSDADGQRSAWS